MTGPGSTVIVALERTWAELRDFHPEVPEVVFITGTGRQKGSIKWGHWNPERWHEQGAINNTIPEVFISGERLAQGARLVLQTLIHEAAHGLCHVRGIKDTSRGHRYHNTKFVRVAEELGLKGPEVACETRGWSDCTILDETVQRYESFPLLEEAIVVSIGAKVDAGGPLAGTQKAPAKPRPKYACGCPERIIRMSAKVFELGPIICGLCEEPFLEDFS